eukprot:1033880_1
MALTSNLEIKYTSVSTISYDNYNASSGTIAQTTRAQNEKCEEQPLTSPYKQTSITSKAEYHAKSLIAKNNRLHTLYLLYQSTVKRGLTILDAYTDIIVTISLYRGGNSMLFMLSCLFLATPFLLVWNGSLRIMQDTLASRLNKVMHDRDRPRSKCYKTFIQFMINLFIMFYVFPLFGMISMLFIEFWWIVYDIFYGFKCFMFGTLYIENTDINHISLKKFRATVETFGESIPQVILQLYMFVNIDGIGIKENDLYLSLFVSGINLVYQFYKFRKEAKFHGLYWFEYTLSVLQLSTISIKKFVPRLPALQKGYIHDINLSAFKFDKESVSLLISTLNNTHEFPECKLEGIKLSIGSIDPLDYNMCRLLGSTLYDHNPQMIKIVTATYENTQIHNIWKQMDKESKGYITKKDFISFLDEHKYPKDDAAERNAMFSQMAIRRIKNRDRVYFYDFYETLMSYKIKRASFKLDILQIFYPFHYICDQVMHLIQKHEITRNKTMDATDEDVTEEDLVTITNDTLSSLRCLYSFCIGAHFLRQNECLYQATKDDEPFLIAFIKAMNVLKAAAIDKEIKETFSDFLWTLFKDILKHEDFTAICDEIFRKRSNVLNHLNSPSKLNEEFLTDSKQANVFEYCFVSSPRCKAFAFMMESYLSFLNQMKIDEILLLTDPDNVYHLYCVTKGFMIEDDECKTPLDYAKKYELNRVIDFYKHFVIHAKNMEQWVPFLSKLSESNSFLMYDLLANDIINQQFDSKLLRVLIEERNADGKDPNLFIEFIKIICQFRGTCLLDDEDEDVFNIAVARNDALLVDVVIDLCYDSQNAIKDNELEWMMQRHDSMLKDIIVKNKYYEILYSLLDCRLFHLHPESQGVDPVEALMSDINALVVLAEALENNSSNHLLQRFTIQQLRRVYDACYDKYEDLTSKGDHIHNKIARNLLETPALCTLIIILMQHLQIEGNEYFKYCLSVVKPSYTPKLADFNHRSYFTSCGTKEFTIWSFEWNNITQKIRHLQIQNDEKEFELEKTAYNAHVDASGEFVIVSHYNTGDVIVYQLDDSRSTLSKYTTLEGQLGHSKKVGYGFFLNVKHGKYAADKNTKYVITSSYDNLCIFWNMETKEIIQRFAYATDYAYEFVYYQLDEAHEHMILLIYVSYDGNVYVCNLETGALIVYWTVMDKQGHPASRAYRLDLSMSGDLLAVGYGENGQIKIYQIDLKEMIPKNGVEIKEPKSCLLIENENGLCPIKFISNDILMWFDKKTDQLYWEKRVNLNKWKRGQFSLPFPVTWYGYNADLGLCVLKTTERYGMLYLLDINKIIIYLTRVVARNRSRKRQVSF